MAPGTKSRAAGAPFGLSGSAAASIGSRSPWRQAATASGSSRSTTSQAYCLGRDLAGQFGRAAVIFGEAHVDAAAVGEGDQKRARLRMAVLSRPAGDRQLRAVTRHPHGTEQHDDAEQKHGQNDADDPAFHAERFLSVNSEHVLQDVADVLFLLRLAALILRLVAAAEQAL